MTDKLDEILDNYVRQLDKEMPYVSETPRVEAKTALTNLITSKVNQARIDALLFARFGSEWGDGSPSDIDDMLKNLMPDYDPWDYMDGGKHMDRLSTLKGGMEE